MSFDRLGRFFLLLGLAGVLTAVSSAQSPAPEDPWQTRLPAFSVDGPPRAAAPILLYFTAPWCGFCKQMERTTLADEEVRAAVAGLRAHKIDFDAQRGLVERFGIRGIPALVLTNDRGEVIDRLTGAVSKETLLGWLSAGEAEAKRRAQGAAERAKALSDLLQTAYSGDPAARAEAIRGLWERAARGDESEKKAALVALDALAKDDRVLADAPLQFWADGLGHADLAVRVVAASRLSKVAPEAAKVYDPWAEEDARRQAIARLVPSLPRPQR